MYESINPIRQNTEASLVANLEENAEKTKYMFNFVNTMQDKNKIKTAKISFEKCGKTSKSC